MRLYRLYLAYNWESEAYKLKGGEGPAKVRAMVEGYFLAHMKATAPEKYHKRLTPNYPVSYFSNFKRTPICFDWNELM